MKSRKYHQANPNIIHPPQAPRHFFRAGANISNIRTFNIFDRVENLIYPAGVLEYEGPISMVFFKDYPTANSDVNYRDNQDHFVHLFADPADGIYRASAENLVSYSYDTGCVDVALKMLPCFIGTDFAVPEGVHSIWCEDSVIYYNDESVAIKQLLKDAQVEYRAILNK